VANGHQFTGQEKFHHASDETKAMAVTLASEGMSVRAIARTCGVYGRAATLWLEKKA
jgi:transposase-like protein